MCKMAPKVVSSEKREKIEKDKKKVSERRENMKANGKGNGDYR